VTSKTRMTLAITLSVMTVFLCRAQDQTTYVREAPGGKGWSIGNELVERELVFDPETGLHSVVWKSKVTGTDFLQRARDEHQWGNEFSVKVDAATLPGAISTADHAAMPKPVSKETAQFDLIGSDHHQINRSGAALEIKLKAKSAPVEVSVFYATYPGHPVIRKWIAVTNRGASPVTLSHLIFESVHLVAGPPKFLELDGLYGAQPREIFFTGRAEDPAIVERDVHTGEGFIVMNEAPGSLKRTETNGWGIGDLQVMYDTDLIPFERRIEPGETFTSAKSSIALFADNHGFADSRWVMPSYTSEIIKRTGAAWQPLWIYNSWEPLHHTINAQNMGDSVPAAARMGLDVFDLDEGWERAFGDNAVSPEHFPQGLDGLRASLESKGVRLGLDQPLAVIDADTPLYKEHPEWQSVDRDGHPQVSRGIFPIMCLASPFKEYTAKRLSDLITKNNLKFVQIDLTTLFDSYGLAPGCSAQGHEHHSWAESLERNYEGIQYVMDYIYREHPDVVLDLTFETWGSYKHGIDYAHIAIADLDYLSNVDDMTPDSAGPIQARTLLYQRSLAIPTENLDIGNLLANSRPIEERFATMIGASPLLNGDLRKLTPAELDWWAQKIAWYKNLRRSIPMNEGFFPLGSWRQPNAMAWDGYAKLSRQGEGILVVFKNDSGAAHVHIELPAYPPGQFNFHSIISQTSPKVISGAELQQGVEIALPENQRVEILEIRKNR
jgi:alpha-galactosidase